MGDVDTQNFIIGNQAAPAESDSITQTQTSGGTTPTPAAKQAIAGEYAAEQGVAGAMQGQSEAEALAQQQKADQLAIDSDLRRQEAADAAAEHQYNLDRIAHARGRAAEAEDAYAGHKFEDYWGKQSTAKKIAQGLFTVLGGYNPGQGNPAVDALNRKIDQDFIEQKAERDKLRDVARMRGEDVGDLYHQINAENGSLAIKQAKAHEAVAAQALEQMTRQGIPVEQAKATVLYQQQLAKAAEKRREAEQHYGKTYGNTTTTKHVLNTGTANSLGAQRLGLQERRVLDKEVGDWAKQNGLPEMARQQREFANIAKKLEGNPDPETQVMALMEMDKAAKGGTATGASMAAALSHLGGTGEKFNAVVERAKTGGLSKGQLQIIRTAVKRGQQVNSDEATHAVEGFDSTFTKSPQRQHQAGDLKDLKEGLFHPFGFTTRTGSAPPVGVAAPPPDSAAPAPPKATPPIGTVPDGKGGFLHGYLTSDGAFHLVP